MTTTSGLVAGERLEEPAHGPERLLHRRVGLDQPDRLADALGHLVGLRVVAQEGSQSSSGRLRVVVRPDVGGRTDDLADRPEGDVLPVGQAATTQDERVAGLLLEEGGDEAALARRPPCPGW